MTGTVDVRIEPSGIPHKGRWTAVVAGIGIMGGLPELIRQLDSEPFRTLIIFAAAATAWVTSLLACAAMFAAAGSSSLQDAHTSVDRTIFFAPLAGAATLTALTVEARSISHGLYLFMVPFVVALGLLGLGLAYALRSQRGQSFSAWLRTPAAKRTLVAIVVAVVVLIGVLGGAAFAVERFASHLRNEQAMVPPAAADLVQSSPTSTTVADTSNPSGSRAIPVSHTGLAASTCLRSPGVGAPDRVEMAMREEFTFWSRDVLGCPSQPPFEVAGGGWAQEYSSSTGRGRLIAGPDGTVSALFIEELRAYDSTFASPLFDPSSVLGGWPLRRITCATGSQVIPFVNASGMTAVLVRPVDSGTYTIVDPDHLSAYLELATGFGQGLPGLVHGGRVTSNPGQLVWSNGEAATAAIASAASSPSQSLQTFFALC